MDRDIFEHTKRNMVFLHFKIPHSLIVQSVDSVAYDFQFKLAG